MKTKIEVLLRKIKNIYRELKRKKENENRKIAQYIGEYYLEKNNHNYKKTIEDLTILGITQIEHKNNIIIITLQRCGILIGRRGDNIEQLQKFLSIKTKYSKIDIKEDKIISWLIPINDNYLDYTLDED